MAKILIIEDNEQNLYLETFILKKKIDTRLSRLVVEKLA